MRPVMARVRSLFRSLRSPDRLEHEMDEEMRLHIELHAERLMAERGLSREAAERAAKLEFGSVDNYKEAARDVRGLNRLTGLSLDMKLGVRMLIKYPGLTVAGTLSIAVAVALAVSWLQFMHGVITPRLPFDEADRIVTVENWNVRAGTREMRSMREYAKWRTELKSITDLMAVAEATTNVTTEDARIGTLRGARMTASGFTLSRIQPLLGRVITEADEAPGAPRVAVIGYDAWQSLFNGDRTVVGRTVRVDGSPTTIIGVMPEGYGYPVNQSIWLPLTKPAFAGEKRSGPAVVMVARLAPGYTFKQAEAEFKVLADRTASASAGSKEQLRPQVRRFGAQGNMRLFAALFNIPFILFLFVVCANVATLVFARTATRESEIAVRTALGASRQRIVAQLFAEALVLTTVGSALGLATARIAMPRGMALFWEVQQTAPPFWFTNRLEASTIAYTFVLAFLAACIIGGVPALKATGKRLRDRIAQPGSGGAGLRFGKISTGVVIAQVALCVGFLPLAIQFARGMLAVQPPELVFPASSFVTGVVTKPLADADAPSWAAVSDERIASDLYTQLQTRLAAEPGVEAVTIASTMPGVNHLDERITIEGDTTLHDEVRRLAVAPNFFEVMKARIIRGRGLTSTDARGGTRAAVVTEAWVQKNLGGRNPIGQRIQFPDRPEDGNLPWYQIVGVVQGMEPAIGAGSPTEVFEALVPAWNSSVQIYARTAGAPEQLVPKIYAMVTGIDQGAAASNVMSLSAAWRPIYRSGIFFAGAISAIAGIILSFALIGIYALMSFTVAQRAREIGIRSALGANPRRIIISIFSRAVIQIGLGVIVGAAVISLTMLKTPKDMQLVGAVAGMMLACGMIGCIVPARRALRIQPTDALRAE